LADRVPLPFEFQFEFSTARSGLSAFLSVDSETLVRILMVNNKTVVLVPLFLTLFFGSSRLTRKRFVFRLSFVPSCSRHRPLTRNATFLAPSFIVVLITLPHPTVLFTINILSKSTAASAIVYMDSFLSYCSHYVHLRRSAPIYSLSLVKRDKQWFTPLLSTGNILFPFRRASFHSFRVPLRVELVFLSVRRLRETLL